MPAPKRSEPPRRIRIAHPAPVIDGGRYAAKRTVGDTVAVSADIFRDGHEKLKAVVKYKAPGGRRWLEAPMRHLDAHIDGVRWAGEFAVEMTGGWQFTIEAWSDVFATWHDELRRKVVANLDEDLSGELSEGVVLLERALARCKGDARRSIEAARDVLADQAAPAQAKYDAALGPELFAAMEAAAERHGATSLDKPISLEVDRVKARFGAWYELFPRSWGGLNAVTEQIPAIAGLGFDVLYLLPIHPIGRNKRKGRNNTLVAGPDDPGSPYAIGAAEGGHTAVHPELGTLDDVKRLTATAHHHGMDVCFDLALNASADHPWLTEHPEWFQQRPDGTLKYAENPPKRYQDIYNFNWDTEAWETLWQAWLDVILHWVAAGVKFYRVDNPHTKPFPFWEWIIKEVHKVDRDVVFLAEAFTKRAVMQELAKLGFTQSYTYFTWKNSRFELQEYVEELAWSEEKEYFRPNFFPVTPDILHAYLVHGGPPAFVTRLVLAGTLAPSYGIYSGYENFENVPVREGSEEYLNSEKYETRQRSLDGPLLPMVQRLNEIRHENVALQHLSNVYWLETQNDALMAYAKQEPGNTVIVVVNIDPHNPQEGLVTIPAQLGLAPVFPVEDQFTGTHYDWRIGQNYVRLDPHAVGNQFHLLKVL
jgi:starch synthase (maltosyl-transferring)